MSQKGEEDVFEDEADRVNSGANLSSSQQGEVLGAWAPGEGDAEVAQNTDVQFH